MNIGDIIIKKELIDKDEVLYHAASSPSIIKHFMRGNAKEFYGVVPEYIITQDPINKDCFCAKAIQAFNKLTYAEVVNVYDYGIAIRFTKGPNNGAYSILDNTEILNWKIHKNNI